MGLLKDDFCGQLRDGHVLHFRTLGPIPSPVDQGPQVCHGHFLLLLSGPCLSDPESGHTWPCCEGGMGRGRWEGHPSPHFALFLIRYYSVKELLLRERWSPEYDAQASQRACPPWHQCPNLLLEDVWTGRKRNFGGGGEFRCVGGVGALRRMGWGDCGEECWWVGGWDKGQEQRQGRRDL